MATLSSDQPDLTRAEAVASLQAAANVLGALGVTLHPSKTRIVHVRCGFEFLGYKIKRGERPLRLRADQIKTGIRRGDLYAFPRQKSVDQFKDQIRKLTCRKAPVTTQALIDQINPIIRGCRLTKPEAVDVAPGVRRSEPQVLGWYRRAKATKHGGALSS